MNIAIVIFLFPYNNIFQIRVPFAPSLKAIILLVVNGCHGVFCHLKWQSHTLRGKMVPGRQRNSYDKLMCFGRDLWCQGSWLVERSTSVE